jgi:hypothetical protein
MPPFVIESCDNMEIRLAAGLMSGTADIMKSHSICLIVTADVSIPTFTVEACENVELLLKNVEKQVNAIYLVDAKDVRVVCPTSSVAMYPLDLPEGHDSSQQYVASWNGTSFSIEAVVREGIGYPSTAAKIKEADKRAEIMRDHLQKLVEESIKISPSKAKAESTVQAEPLVSTNNNKEQQSLPETVPPLPISADALTYGRNQLKPTQVICCSFLAICINCTVDFLLCLDC